MRPDGSKGPSMQLWEGADGAFRIRTTSSVISGKKALGVSKEEEGGQCGELGGEFRRGN